MIHDATGDLLRADAEALVNTVNTVGVMGKGIALQFRHAYPQNYAAYRQACARGGVEPGRMLVVPVMDEGPVRFIINFPTKRHWRGKARMEDLEAGLVDLVRVVREAGIRSIAVPPLGCGNGGLDWEQVRPRIEGAFAELPEVIVYLYGPHGAPEPASLRVRTERPGLTIARAAWITLMESYLVLDFALTRSEIQKLAYFLQEAGEPLNLNYAKGRYGPYAENLNPAIQRLEGHYLRGYGDRSGPSEIRLLPGSAEEAAAFLRHHPETEVRLGAVRRLIEGFESPYGMELLATVHWVGQREDPAAQTDPEAAVRLVQAWSPQKRAKFRPEHIRIAWRRLREHGWIGRPETLVA